MFKQDFKTFLEYRKRKIKDIVEELTKINELKQSMQIIDQVGRKFDGCVYNSYERPKGYYGYYDIYGDYSYRYYAERYLYDDYQLKDD